MTESSHQFLHHFTAFTQHIASNPMFKSHSTLKLIFSNITFLGIPSTLNYVDLNDGNNSPNLKPYPGTDDVQDLVSVYRPRVDSCHRLWAVDTGLLEVPGKQTPREFNSSNFCRQRRKYYMFYHRFQNSL